MMRQLATFLLFAIISSGLSCTPPQAVSLSNVREPEEQIVMSGGVIDIQFKGEFGRVPPKEIDRWIHTAASAVQHYFGHYPVKRLDLHVRLKEGGKIEDGVTFEGRRIEISVGTDTPSAIFDADWTLTHEMFHLAFPDLDEKHVWMNEGLSTYLEPIARVRIGNISVEQFWRETLDGMPDGLPEPGDRGLDRTHTWGRTYWGGALFWFIADVRIREQTAGHKSLDDSIHGILAAGGDGSVTWSIAKVIEVGDRATGTNVLATLYDEMGQKASAPDLKDLWKRLGVAIQGNRVVFDDGAPLVEVRMGLTQKYKD